MTKKEIVKTISEEMALTQLKTKKIVQKTFDAIIDTLVEDTEEKLQSGSGGALGRIELRNFGVFEVKRRAARKARNPRTGERVDVPEKFVVTFKPGKQMEERVRQLEERQAARKRAAVGGATGDGKAQTPQEETSQTIPINQGEYSPTGSSINSEPSSGASFNADHDRFG